MAYGRQKREAPAAPTETTAELAEIATSLTGIPDIAPTRRATKEPTQRLRALPAQEDGAEAKKFADKVQAAIENLLELELEPKDANALIANAIRLLAVQLKMSGGGDGDGSFWDD